MTFAQWIYGLWIAQLALEPLLLVLLVLKKVWKKYPFFTAYLVCSMIGDFSTFALLHHHRLYAFVYLVYETVSVGLALALTYEVFTHLFLSYRALRRLASISFQVAGAFLVLLGAGVILAHSPIGQKGIATAIAVVEESYRVLEVGLIIALFVFSTAFGLHWRRQVFGILLGLGFSSSVKLATLAITPHSYVAAGTLTIAIILSFNLGLLIWLGYILIPESVVSNAELPRPSQLEQWNRAVMELIHQ